MADQLQRARLSAFNVVIPPEDRDFLVEVRMAEVVDAS
jgi:hypothetical protein